MTIYHMSCSLDEFWHPCCAKTLRGAKAEATRKYGKRRSDALIEITDWDGTRGDAIVIAARKRVGARRWETV